MALVEPLRDGIVAADVEPHLVDRDRLGVDVLIVAQAMQIAGHERLDDERAVVGEVGGDVLEAAHLLVLVQQVEERVVDDVDQPVAAGARRPRRSRPSSPRSPRRRAWRAASRPSPARCRCRRHATPRAASGSAIRPVPIGELERRPPCRRAAPGTRPSSSSSPARDVVVDRGRRRVRSSSTARIRPPHDLRAPRGAARAGAARRRRGRARSAAPVGVAGLVGATEAAQQLAARRVQVAVVVELEPIDDVEPGRGPSRLGDRDGPVSSTTGEPVSRASSP